MSGPEQRDRALEHLLRQSADAGAGNDDACLDAETLAAWLDGGLPAAAREATEAHVATCARCQVLVGAMARTEPVVVPAERPQRAWFGWLVPLTAAAAALVMWVALPREAPPAPPEQMAARAEPVAPPVLQEAPAATQSKDASAPRPATEAVDNLQVQRRDEPARERSALADAVPQAGTSALEADKAAAPLREERFAAAPAPPPSAAAPAPAAMARAVVGEVTVVSADGSVRWGLNADAVSKSMAGGLRVGVLTGNGRYFTAGSAPSAEVCWLVGRGGLVMRTVDGQTFAAIPFPQPTDLIAVSAPDANRATVTTTSGQVFVTSDAGVTWRPQ